MIECPKCKATVEPDSWFCDQCGQELRICPACGTYGKGKRCTQCGTLLITAKEKFAPGNEAIRENESGKVSFKLSAQPETRPLQENTEKTMRQPSASILPVIALKNALLGITLHAANEAIIGRRSGAYANLLGTHAYVSGTHARFDYDPSGYWTITDLDSTNGTFCNGTRLEANMPYRLNVGETIQIADLLFVVEFCKSGTFH